MNITENFSVENFKSELEKELESYENGSCTQNRLLVSETGFFDSISDEMIRKTVFNDTKGEKGVSLGSMTVIPNVGLRNKFPRLKDKTGIYQLECGLIGVTKHFDKYQVFLFRHFQELRISKLDDFFSRIQNLGIFTFANSTFNILSVEKGAYGCEVRIKVENEPIAYIVKFDTLKMQYYVEHCGYRIADI